MPFNIVMVLTMLNATKVARVAFPPRTKVAGLPSYRVFFPCSSAVLTVQHVSTMCYHAFNIKYSTHILYSRKLTLKIAIPSK